MSEPSSNGNGGGAPEARGLRVGVSFMKAFAAPPNWVLSSAKMSFGAASVEASAALRASLEHAARELRNAERGLAAILRGLGI